jgi:hypothetical protein
LCIKLLMAQDILCIATILLHLATFSPKIVSREN